MKELLLPLLSKAYRWTRQRTIRDVYEKQNREQHPQDLEEVVVRGDKKLKVLPKYFSTFSIPEGIGVQFHDLYFPSPLTLAAFKDDLEIISRWMSLGLGGACIKTVMKEPREGNPRPRLQEVTVESAPNGFGHTIPLSCLINAMGLPGHGVEGKIREFEQSEIFSHNRPIGISIGGSSLEEYKSNFDKLNEHLLRRKENIRSGIKFQYYFEVNISCPNTSEGQQMTKHSELLEEILKYMRSKTDRVIGVKLSPDAVDKDLMRFAELVRGYAKTYVNLGNTTYRKCHQVGLPENAISIGGGGLSGPALFPRTLAMTQLIAPMKIPICATGGVDTAVKVRTLRDAARNYDVPLIIGMATAVVKDMYCIPGINRQLAAQKKKDIWNHGRF